MAQDQFQFRNVFTGSQRGPRCADHWDQIGIDQEATPSAGWQHWDVNVSML